MTSERPSGALARLWNLVSGRLTVWVRERENRSPRAVYEQAIAQRIAHYEHLKEAVAGILYLRAKLEDPDGPPLFITEPRSGYRFVSD